MLNVIWSLIYFISYDVWLTNDDLGGNNSKSEGNKNSGDEAEHHNNLKVIPKVTSHLEGLCQSKSNAADTMKMCSQKRSHVGGTDH